MSNLEIKTLVAYHNNCIDGITSAAVMRYYLMTHCAMLEENIIFFAADYNEASYISLLGIVASEEVAEVFVVDFSYTEKQLYEIYHHVGAVHMYDHHETAFKRFMPPSMELKSDSSLVVQLSEPDNIHDRADINIHLYNNECGASLVYKALILKDMAAEDFLLPMLIQYVRDYDLWHKKLPDTEAVNKYLRTLPKSPDVFEGLITDMQSTKFENSCARLGNELIKYEHKLELELLSSGTTPVAINGIKGLAVNAPMQFASSLGHALAESSGTFGAVWTQVAGDKVKWSLRSIGDSYNVSELAETMGGGGHKNAAGFELSNPTQGQGITLWSQVTNDGSEAEEETHS